MLYEEKCPKCGTVQKGLDLRETEGSYICSHCKTEVKVYKENLKTNDIDEKQLLMLEELLTDDTRWDLMTGKELERRLKVYENTGNSDDFIKALSCLRLASVYYLKADKESNNVIITTTSKGDYLPIYSSKRRISKDDKEKYYAQETYFTELCKIFKKEKQFAGIILNSNSNRLTINNEQLLPLMDAIDRISESFDTMMEEGIDGEALSDVMLERFGGRKVHVELKDGKVIEGEVWSSHKEDESFYLDLKSDQDEETVNRDNIKKIKAYPFD